MDDPSTTIVAARYYHCMSGKRRLSASVDPDLVAAARKAVRRGTAPNVSSWVNEALRRQVQHESRLSALAEFVALFEAEHGVITAAEMSLAAREARANAVVVRGRSSRTATGSRRRGA